jgi:ADP-ribosylation factor-like protein 2
MTLQQIREYLELDLIQTRHWGIIACSAVTGDGLLEGIDWIVSDIGSRIFLLS